MAEDSVNAVVKSFKAAFDGPVDGGVVADPVEYCAINHSTGQRIQTKGWVEVPPTIEIDAQMYQHLGHLVYKTHKRVGAGAGLLSFLRNARVRLND